MLFSVPSQPDGSHDTAEPAATATADNPYTMRISRLTVDKLGIKMYDRVSAVLAEVIANAYDADAENVKVNLPWGVFLAEKPGSPPVGPYEISIVDDGHGMTAEEVNANYLTVGSDRRKRFGKDSSRDKNRPVMGRKGIGKLAPFGICETVEVITAGGEETEDGYEVAHLILSLNDILDDTDTVYHPKPGNLNGTWSAHHGTTIKLRDFRRKKVPTGNELHRQLSARFGIQRIDWDVELHNTEQTLLQETLHLGELAIDILDDTKMVLDDRCVETESGEKLPISGWLAYTRKPYKDEAMAGIRIFSRGKIVAQTRDFQIGSGFTGEYSIRSYLVGEIHAEWLDQNEDLIRSDRQDIIWSSEVGDALKRWGQAVIKELAKRGKNALAKQVWTDFEQTTNLEERLKQEAPGDKAYQESVKQAAKLLVSDRDREAASDPKQAEKIVDLAKTIGPHKTLLEALHEVSEVSDSPLDIILGLFQKARIAEMYSLGQVASERIEVVNKLSSMINDGTTLEQPLQELLEQAPWLLAPEWTPLGMNESLERVRKSFEAWYFKKEGVALVTSAINRHRREPDFVLLHDSGTLWIVEIKRMDYHLTNDEYLRAVNYLSDLDDFLNENPTLGRQFPIRKLTFIADHTDKLSSVSLSSMKNDERIAIRGWHELLDDTLRAHRDFLARVENLRHDSVPGQRIDADGS
ncbi:ATP-binding protein [Streptomyces flavotricini]|uniref:ATP-binding protein n=1 Tax=Streptomyces flavotricini TaxID=66888 RepID=A0ABS8EBJ2_9ACTN|nr:ATP-binding protein [Streptomyces flavotricini]MCC0098385.1 ATP-binding protein [Streptomyces flavotricini]